MTCSPTATPDGGCCALGSGLVASAFCLPRHFPANLLLSGVSPSPPPPLFQRFSSFRSFGALSQLLWFTTHTLFLSVNFGAPKIKGMRFLSFGNFGALYLLIWRAGLCLAVISIFSCAAAVAEAVSAESVVVADAVATDGAAAVLSDFPAAFAAPALPLPRTFARYEGCLDSWQGWPGGRWGSSNLPNFSTLQGAESRWLPAISCGSPRWLTSCGVLLLCYHCWRWRVSGQSP